MAEKEVKFINIYTDDKTKEPTKKEISTEAYAIGQLIEALKDEIMRSRLNG